MRCNENRHQDSVSYTCIITEQGVTSLPPWLVVRRLATVRVVVKVRVGRAAVGRLRLVRRVNVASGTVLGQGLLNPRRRCRILGLVTNGRQLNGLSRPGIA